MHPASIHDHALFTIDQITRKFKLDAKERNYLLVKLDGREVTRSHAYGKYGALWYRWVAIQRVLTELGVLV